MKDALYNFADQIAKELYDLFHEALDLLGIKPIFILFIILGIGIALSHEKPPSIPISKIDSINLKK